LLWEYTIGLGNIGYIDYASSACTDISDINNDGINDIAVASADGFAHVLQDVTCKARFNDTATLYNMTWNYTNVKWETNRTFASAGMYNYNITCEKGGYTEQFEGSDISVGSGNNAPDTPSPSLVSVDGTNQTGSDLNCSDTLSDPDGDDMNVTVRWYKNYVLDLTFDYNNSYSNASTFGALLGSGNTSKSDNWSCSLRLHDGTDYSSWANSSNLTILANPPSSNKFIITNSSNDNVASIDDKGDMYLRGIVSQSQGALSPTHNSFIIQNSSGDTISYFNNTGSLFLFGTITQSSDLSGMTSTNLEFRNSTNDLVAFFDNLGNLKLKGVFNENYVNP